MYTDKYLNNISFSNSLWTRTNGPCRRLPRLGGIAAATSLKAANFVIYAAWLDQCFKMLKIRKSAAGGDFFFFFFVFYSRRRRNFSLFTAGGGEIFRNFDHFDLAGNKPEACKITSSDKCSWRLDSPNVIPPNLGKSTWFLELIILIYLKSTWLVDIGD